MTLSSPYLFAMLLAFRQRMAYRMAAWAGLLTNTFFLFIRCGVFMAVYRLGAGPDERIGGYGMSDTLGYTVLTQAFLMVAPQWGGGGADMGVGERVRTGQIAMDLARPVNYALFQLWQRLGHSAFHLLTRCIPILAVGMLAGYLTVWPAAQDLPALVLSVALAAWIANSLLLLAECSAFWMETDRGARKLMGAFASLFTGLTVPVAFFPGWLGAVSSALPFEYTLHTVSHIWLGKAHGVDAWHLVMMQGLWAVGLTLLIELVVRRGTRKLVINGG